MSTLTIFFFTLQSIALYLNIVFLLITFVGSLYVAIHARRIPIWIRTPLWYLGCTSLLVAGSIVCEWTLGPQFIMSYSRFGLIGETLINFFIALNSALMLVHTVIIDIKNSKMRRRHDD